MFIWFRLVTTLQFLPKKVISVIYSVNSFILSCLKHWFNLLLAVQVIACQIRDNVTNNVEKRKVTHLSGVCLFGVTNQFFRNILMEANNVNTKMLIIKLCKVMKFLRNHCFKGTGVLTLSISHVFYLNFPMNDFIS